MLLLQQIPYRIAHSNNIEQTSEKTENKFSNGWSIHENWTLNVQF